MFGRITNLVLVIVGFLGMEIVTYLVHRFVMHGALERLHVSHHRNAAAEFATKTPEPNDVFPFAFSICAAVGVWLGFNADGLAWLLPVLVGVTSYGVLYTVVHDGIIHGRIRWMKRFEFAWSRKLEVAHRSHHRANGEPYGMLFPWLTMESLEADHARPRFPSTSTARSVRTFPRRTSVHSGREPLHVDASVRFARSRPLQEDPARH